MEVVGCLQEQSRDQGWTSFEGSVTVDDHEAVKSGDLEGTLVSLLVVEPVQRGLPRSSGPRRSEGVDASR